MNCGSGCRRRRAEFVLDGRLRSGRAIGRMPCLEADLNVQPGRFLVRGNAHRGRVFQIENQSRACWCVQRDSHLPYQSVAYRKSACPFPGQVNSRVGQIDDDSRGALQVLRMRFYRLVQFHCDGCGLRTGVATDRGDGGWLGGQRKHGEQSRHAGAAKPVPPPVPAIGQPRRRGSCADGECCYQSALRLSVSSCKCDPRRP